MCAQSIDQNPTLIHSFTDFTINEEFLKCGNKNDEKKVKKNISSTFVEHECIDFNNKNKL